ncbi:MAG: methionine--tRNA ligase [Balneolales bacterium]
MSKRTLVTAALPYANGPLHLGHLAGAYLPSDFYVRYKRMREEDILFICGSDEHGVPITLAAEKEKVSPQNIVDHYHNLNKESFDRMGISFDYFGRTSSETHREVSQSFFKKLDEKGVFKKKAQTQLYDPKAKMFLPDRYVVGTCPHCGNDEAYGDQCEKCGTSLSPTELINPHSVITGEVPVHKETEHWFIPLGDFQEKLSAWLDQQEDWKPNVMGQCRSWLDNGLHDRAVTRDLTWGVPVPYNDADGKVLYVWFDAPIGYISATREWAENQGNPDLWKTWWQDQDTDLIHFIGKDNIVFHCIMFPAMLMAHGEYILPKNVPANEFLNLEGQKLSTSKGWAVWLHEYLDDLDPDYLRYVIGTSLPEAKDSDFSWKDFQARVNGELADILGNFIFRTLSFTQRYFDAKVPELINPGAREHEVLGEIEEIKTKVTQAYETYHFREAIAQSMNLARLGNKYFTEMEPWHLRKNDLEKCGTVLHICLQISAALSLLFDPVMPGKMKKLREYLATKSLSWNEITSNMLPVGQVIDQGEILFKKIDDEQINKQLEKLQEHTKSNKNLTNFEPLKDEIDFETFSSMDLRTGKIISANKVPKSKNLLNLQVDLGFEIRTVVSGIAKQYTAEDLKGTNVVMLANLAPKKMMGIESQGMILMAEDKDGKFHFLTTEAEPGSVIS